MQDHNTRLIVIGRDVAAARYVAEALVREAFQNAAYFHGSFQEAQATLTMSELRALTDRVDQLFDWYFDGEVDVQTADPRWVFHTLEAGARHISEGFGNRGCLVSGRRLFGHTDGWASGTRSGAPVVVV